MPVGIPWLGCMGVAYNDMMDALSTFGEVLTDGVGRGIEKKREEKREES